MTKHFQSELGVAEQGLVGKHEFQPPRPDVQPANLTDNWAHPGRGPRLPEIEPGDESLPCEGCHGNAKAHKEAVRARMLAEFAARDAAADAMRAIVAASRLAFAPAQFTPEMLTALHSDLRQACHGNTGNYQNVVRVLQGWGADIGHAR